MSLKNWRSLVEKELWTRIISNQSQSHIATDGRSVSKPWCRAPSGPHDQIFITVWQLRSFFTWGRPLWREDGSVFCICYWALPAQSFSGPSPLVLATIFYRLKIETYFFVASYDSQGHGGGIRPRLHPSKESYRLSLIKKLRKLRPILQKRERAPKWVGATRKKKNV
jgi:hypothetical protein